MGVERGVGPARAQGGAHARTGTGAHRSLEETLTEAVANAEPTTTGRPAPATAALELNGLSKRFGNKRAVSDLNLRVEQGELYALLGPNGAGKTTTLRLVAGLLTPSSGDAFILGKSITETPGQAKANLAFLPDDPATSSAGRAWLWRSRFLLSPSSARGTTRGRSNRWIGRIAYVHRNSPRTK